MGFISLVIALSLLMVAIFCILYLGQRIVYPLLALFRGKKHSTATVKATRKLSKVDSLIGSGKYLEAIKILQSSIVLDTALDPSKISALKNHYQNLLSRCLIISEELGSRADNLAEVERLLMQRCELQTLLLKAEESFQSLRSRRKQAGKHMPSWSKSDFETRIVQIKEELNNNRQVLEPALTKLFEALKVPDRENIVYH